MNLTEYPQVASFEELANTAQREIQKEVRSFNYVLRGELSRADVVGKPIADMTTKAELWRREEVPDELIINHGSYIKGGVERISSELRAKPTSNRALYSLINDSEITSSGDQPIPSFMIFQCGMDGDVLYCTAYFRALEVCSFLRVNLEEIRLNLCDILGSIDAKCIRISIFAFSAYNRPQQSMLEKPELDRLQNVSLFDLLNNDHEKVVEMLEEKAKEATFVDVAGLSIIEQWADPKRKNYRPNVANINAIYAAAKSAIAASRELEKVRLRHSVHNTVSEAATKYSAAIELLAGEFKKCH